MTLALPGEPVAVEEEAIPVEGADVSRDGLVRSMVVGVLQLDRYKKLVRVKPLNRRDLLLRQGVIVEGLVTSVSEDLAIVKIYSAEGNTRYNAIGLLHVSQIAGEFVASIYDYIKPSDIVRAKVLNSAPPYLLSTKEPQTGVILAQCSYCGSTLYLAKTGLLYCKVCGRQEKRKVAVGYLYVLR
jgi:exosome complex component CSL4